jgi:anti-anti-sigma factor
MTRNGTPPVNTIAPLDIDVHVAPAGAVIRIYGELDLAGKSRLAAALDRAGERDVTVDLTHLMFLDCCGYAALAERATQLAANGHDLRLVGARGQVQRLLQLVSGLAREPTLAAPIPLLLRQRARSRGGRNTAQPRRSTGWSHSKPHYSYPG